MEIWDLETNSDPRKRKKWNTAWTVISAGVRAFAEVLFQLYNCFIPTLGKPSTV